MADEATTNTSNSRRMMSDQAFESYQELIAESINLSNLRVSVTGEQKHLFIKRLDTVGDGTGDFNMSVDGSATPVVFKLSPPAGEIWRVAKWSLYVQDTGNFDATLWGNGIGLTNGILLKITNGAIVDLIQLPIKNTGDVGVIADSLNYLTFGQGDNILVAYLSFVDIGQFIRLVGDNGDSLEVHIRDNLTGLSSQYVQASGYKE